MTIDRRAVMAAATSALAVAVSGPAMALDIDDAKNLVSETVNDIFALLRDPGTANNRAEALQAIMEMRSNLPLLAKFSAGRAWREMSDGQKEAFVTAFSRYIAVTYARRFDEYAGDPKVTIGKAIDAGRKGILVASPIRNGSAEPVLVEWLVSDRAGRVEVVDLIIEGISMAASQREEITAMLDKRGGDVDKLIADLEAAS